jgi:hypothetical protein
MRNFIEINVRKIIINLLTNYKKAVEETVKYTLGITSTNIYKLLIED